MAGAFLIDENLPFDISVWKTPDFVHSKDLGKSCNDGFLWNYAKENNLIILTKDSDFSNRIIVSQPPPKVVHYRIGNMRSAALAEFIAKTWPQVLTLLETNKLVNVYFDSLEAIE